MQKKEVIMIIVIMIPVVLFYITLLFLIFSFVICSLFCHREKKNRNVFCVKKQALLTVRKQSHKILALQKKYIPDFIRICMDFPVSSVFL